MKRNLLLVPCVMSIITMLIAGIFFVLDSGQQTNRSMISVLLAGVCMIAGFVCNAVYCKRARRDQYDVRSLAKINIGLKLFHLPLGIAFLVVGVVLSFYIIYFLPDLFQDGWVFVIVIMLLLAIGMFGGVAFVETLQSGLISMACAARAREEGFIDKKVEHRYRLWSCVPIADLVVAVRMWKRVK